MLEHNDSSSAQSSPSDATETVGDRLEKLRKKVSNLSETLKRVEEAVAEAGGHLKE
jgi:hypothetical protein